MSFKLFLIVLQISSLLYMATQCSHAFQVEWRFQETVLPVTMYNALISILFFKNAVFNDLNDFKPFLQ